VDERIVAILRHSESIIDAMLIGLGEGAIVLHVILISSAFFDSGGRAGFAHAMGDVRCSAARGACARHATTTCVKDTESTPY
jgi:hypothetical protein